ncbi:serine/threonine protein kinase KIN1/2 [Nematocida sp. LUAm3]|nr:serine/threonine protein kinase KIN1/2 [Nematocida sp. LUAm3]KAI5175633.1 serine/threonine protein kinase KIN1/2 [Nematocida sp. LUAm2]KAI5178539.1 serine/threonine protein kinase KIN1/2 [Nematocida sp. LUAm1]
MPRKDKYSAEAADELRIKNYQLKELIESGTTSSVYHAVNTRTKRHVAIKIISRRNYIEIAENRQSRENRILQEALISYLLSHKYIVKLQEFFYTKEYFYLVFDYIKGEQLYQRILRNEQLSEQIAKKYFLQMLSAIHYCHVHNLVHRDIKIENILIDKNDNAMLIDFGLSNFYEEKGLLRTFCGSLYFAAPELLSGQEYKGPEVDVWSLGIVLYAMVKGKVPFQDTNVPQQYNRIKTENPCLKDLSPEMCSLIERMLDKNRETRITLREVFKHPWIKMKDKIEEPKKCNVDPQSAAYISYLFNHQFRTREGGYSDSLFSIASLFKGKIIGPVLSTRTESISQFIGGMHHFHVHNTLLKNWKGIKMEKEHFITTLESVLKEVGANYEISMKGYQCSLNETYFPIKISRNLISRAYGIRLDAKKRCEKVKELEKQIIIRLKELSRDIPLISSKFPQINNS